MSRILVVDDDPNTVTVFCGILRHSGHDALGVESGTQALEHLLLHPIDVVISDLRLPDMSGLDVLQRIRNQGNDAPFIVITGWGTREEAVLALRLHATDFLEKPVFEDDLLNSVARAAAGGHVSATRDVASDNQRTHAADVKRYAAARLARAIVPLIGLPDDPRTVADWARAIATSVGALRNLCWMAGVSARRALVFARLMRAVSLSQRDAQKLENILDICDPRTLRGLLKLAGFDDRDKLPSTISDFLERQMLLTDGDSVQALVEMLADPCGHRWAITSGADDPPAKKLQPPRATSSRPTPREK